MSRRELLEALVWLTKWFGGRREKLYERLSFCESYVVENLMAELDQSTEGLTRVQLCGFTLIVEYNVAGVTIMSVEPPDLLTGNQLALFDIGTEEMLFRDS